MLADPPSLKVILGVFEVVAELLPPRIFLVAEDIGDDVFKQQARNGQKRGT